METLSVLFLVVHLKFIFIYFGTRTDLFVPQFNVFLLKNDGNFEISSTLGGKRGLQRASPELFSIAVDGTHQRRGVAKLLFKIWLIIFRRKGINPSLSEWT